MTSSKKVMKNRRRVARQYHKHVKMGRCAYGGCRRKARRDRVLCHYHGKRQSEAARLRHAMLLAEIEGLKLLLERMAA